MKKILSILVISLFIVGSGTIIRNSFVPSSSTFKFVESPKVEQVYSFKDSLIIYMFQVGIQNIDIVYTQAILETGYFKSSLFKEGHNMFGMKLARQRETTAIGEMLGHAKFSCWEDSVLDYFMWQEKYAKDLTREEYLDYIDKVYSVNNQYKKLITKIMHRDKVSEYVMDVIENYKLWENGK